MKNTLRSICFTLLVIASPMALAADPPIEPIQPLAPVVVEDRLEIAFAPYLWAAGLKGDVGVFGLDPVSVDASFSDILDNLDFALMGVLDARYGNFGLFVDVAYINLSSDGNLPGPLATPFSTEITSAFVTPMAYFRLFDNGAGTSLDAMAGARIWQSKTQVSIGAAVNASQTDTWVDGTVGLKGRANLTDRFYLTGWGIVGGISSDFMWDVFGGVGWDATSWFSLVAGYRGLGVDYSDSNFVYDITEYGPVLGGVFRF